MNPSQTGWKPVSIGDSLLIGSAEGGFCELEEFIPSAPISLQGKADSKDEAIAHAEKQGMAQGFPACKM